MTTPLTHSLPRPGRRGQPRGERKSLLLDLSRIRLLLWNGLKFGLFPGARFLPFFPHHRKPFPVRLRMALEALGLTYLKLGQFLAMRFDILPADVCKELGRLFDRIPGMPFDSVQTVIEEEFGKPLDQLFTAFNPEPIAAASVAQVHEARLRSGQRVAVKVQRTGLRPIFLADIRNLHRLAVFIDAIGLSGYLSVQGMVDEFTHWTLRELDFTVEGRTADRVRRTADPSVKVPWVYWELTSPRVLTMEFISGLNAADVGDLFAAGGERLVRTRLAGFDVNLALHRFAQASLSQLFTVGFFHADAHPGNIFFCDDNIVEFLDFGIFGNLTRAERDIVTGQAVNLALGNILESFRFYTRQLVPTEETDFERVRQQCLHILQTWYEACLDPSLPIEQRHPAKYIGDMIEVSRQNGLRYCLNYLLFWRALNSLNSTAWRVDLRFDLLKELKSFFEETQPGMAQRALAMVTDQGWHKANFELANHLKPQLVAALENLSARTTSWQIEAGEAPRQRRAAADHVHWLTGAIGMSAVAILISVGRVTWPLGLVFAGVFLVGLVIAYWRQP
jgi:ubiquinone biosynthesis protein